jgi:hypothetical protein
MTTSKSHITNATNEEYDGDDLMDRIYDRNGRKKDDAKFIAGGGQAAYCIS